MLNPLSYGGNEDARGKLVTVERIGIKPWMDWFFSRIRQHLGCWQIIN